MQQKGLCVNCVNDGICTFPRRAPVVECEEYECANNQTPRELPQRKMMQFDEEPTVWE